MVIRTCLVVLAALVATTARAQSLPIPFPSRTADVCAGARVQIELHNGSRVEGPLVELDGPAVVVGTRTNPTVVMKSDIARFHVDCPTPPAPPPPRWQLARTIIEALLVAQSAPPITVAIALLALSSIMVVVSLGTLFAIEEQGPVGVPNAVLAASITGALVLVLLLFALVVIVPSLVLAALGSRIANFAVDWLLGKFDERVR